MTWGTSKIIWRHCNILYPSALWFCHRCRSIPGPVVGRHTASDPLRFTDHCSCKPCFLLVGAKCPDLLGDWWAMIGHVWRRDQDPDSELTGRAGSGNPRNLGLWEAASAPTVYMWSKLASDSDMARTFGLTCTKAFLVLYNFVFLVRHFYYFAIFH